MQEFHKNDFVNVKDFMMRLKMGKRIHLKEYGADNLIEDLNALFEGIVDVERIRVGKRQTINTLICEETLLFAKYLRHERREWSPRLASL